MTLVVTVKGSDGIALAADSRVTLQYRGFPSTFDNATKLLDLRDPHSWVGAVVSGVAIINGRTHHSHIPEFEGTLPSTRISVCEVAQRLSNFFLDKWSLSGQSDNSGNASFIVCGYDSGDIHGKVYRFRIPDAPDPVEVLQGIFGLSWGGQTNIVNRILLGHDARIMAILRESFSFDEEQIANLRALLQNEIQYPIPYDTLALQDCVDLATYLIRTTIEAQNLSHVRRGVGGAIDVATITQGLGLKWVKKKQMQGGQQ